MTRKWHICWRIDTRLQKRMVHKQVSISKSFYSTLSHNQENHHKTLWSSTLFGPLQSYTPCVVFPSYNSWFSNTPHLSKCLIPLKWYSVPIRLHHFPYSFKEGPSTFELIYYSNPLEYFLSHNPFLNTILNVLSEAFPPHHSKLTPTLLK